MKSNRTFLGIAILTAVTGCQSDAAKPEPAPTTTTATTAGTTSGTTATDPSKDTKTATDPQAKKNPGGKEDNAKRVWQLRQLEQVDVTVNGHKLQLWVMDTGSKEQEGMMWLENDDVKDDQGMIFVFSDEAQRSFWMQNTVLPLDIIYVAANKKTDSVVQGKPFDESALPSKGKAKYVVELKKGMAKKYGIVAGSVFTIPDSVKAK